MICCYVMGYAWAQFLWGYCSRKKEVLERQVSSALVVQQTRLKFALDEWVYNCTSNLLHDEENHSIYYTISSVILGKSSECESHSNFDTNSMLPC